MRAVIKATGDYAYPAALAQVQVSILSMKLFPE